MDLKRLAAAFLVATVTISGMGSLLIWHPQPIAVEAIELSDYDRGQVVPRDVNEDAGAAPSPTDALDEDPVTGDLAGDDAADDRDTKSGGDDDGSEQAATGGTTQRQDDDDDEAGDRGSGTDDDSDTDVDD